MNRRRARPCPSPRGRRALLAFTALATLSLAPAPGAGLLAATVSWAGAGTSNRWSDALNWAGNAVPANGDDLLFGGVPPRMTSVLDLSRSFGALTFAPNAGAFVLHVAGDGNAMLDLSGAGLRNLTAGSGPIRQALFADAGSSGGVLQFSGAAGVNLGLGFSARAVDLTASGASVAGQSGGHIVLQDLASLGTDTFDAVRVQGASASGASAADVSLRGSALADRFSTITLAGGTAAGALGGAASFADMARGAGAINVLAGDGGGAGGRVDVSGSATLTASSSLLQQGATSATVGAEAASSLRGDARMIGSAQNGAGTTAGAPGGRLEFFGRASHDTRTLDPSLGIQIIDNAGASASGAGAGSLVFHDDAAVLGTQLLIRNTTSEGAGLGTVGGSTTFMDRARAGAVSIENAGTAGSGAVGGVTRFYNQASAGSAAITMRGGSADGAAGGALFFGDDSSAATAQLRTDGGAAAGALGGSARFTGRATAANAAVTNGGGSEAGAAGGVTLFENTASAGQATIVNAVGATSGGAGGSTMFSASAGAGNAYITNQAALGGGAGGRGSTVFTATSSAQNATIDNLGGVQAINGYTTFSQSATAGSALITNFGGRAAGVIGGSTQFLDQSSAGSATLLMAGGGVSGALGGQAEFFAGTSAGNARLQLQGAFVIGAAGGKLNFAEGASAGNAQITVQGSQANNVGGPEGSTVQFNSYVTGAGLVATASTASFTIGGNVFAFGSPGRVLINGGSTAADASFDTVAGFDAGGRLSFEGSAAHLSLAGQARITNGSRSSASGSTGDFGGATLFMAYSSADHAAITNQAGRTAFGAQTVFRFNSTAADATIRNAGGAAGDTGGITFFQDTANAGRAVIGNAAGTGNAVGTTSFGNTASAAQSAITAAGGSASGQLGGRVIFTDTSTAAQATLAAEGGSNGGGGGRIEFRQQATGGTARIVLGAGGGSGDAGGVLDISGIATWLSVGAVEGGGAIALGARSLIVGSSGQATTFSGVISGSTPPVFPSLSVLGGALTLTGANTHTGRTSIGDGVNAGSGKLVVANTSGSATGSGAVLVQRGGTLAGSGFIAGPVMLMDGGTIAPGDPVTLSLRDSLTWDGGGVIRLVIGADDAGSDHLVLHRLVRGSAGSFNLQLVDAGFTPGASYALLQFDEIDGFAAGDFSVSGLAGSFSLAGGTLGFTAAVPEPGAATLCIVGLLAMRVGLARARRRQQVALGVGSGSTSWP